ncbi:MAG: pilus assembly protein PilP [Gammaproteobacteria bacterium]|nr:pilus assembly protein PilP [Gammaproteobacteria bacterium]
MSDLESYVQSVLARKGGEIEPLPAIKPYEVYTYNSTGEKDPFEPFFKPDPGEIPDGTADDESGVRPDPNRNREELEQYPLDALRMVGTLERDEATWAVVADTAGAIHRVQVGNYLGQNHGKIVAVLEDRIELVEISRSVAGGWEQRSASLALVE